jgi:hypothetical protein
MDEYISHKQLNKAKERVLYDYFNKTTQIPVHKFRGMTMSSHGRVEKPKGLVIENYFDGTISELIKSVARSAVVIHWWTPHAPSVLTYDNPYHISCEPFENETMLDRRTGCPTPVNEWFVHHHNIRSWQEYSHGRASRTRNAGGGLNVEYPNNFSVWKEMSVLSTGCNNLGKEFSLSMVPVVYKRLHETAKNYCTHRPSVCSGRVTPNLIYEALLSGNFSRVMKLTPDKWRLLPHEWVKSSNDMDFLPQ